MKNTQANRRLILLFLLIATAFAFTITINTQRKSDNFFKKSIGAYTFTLIPLGTDDLVNMYGKNVYSLPNSSIDSIKIGYARNVCFLLDVQVEGHQGSIVDYPEQDNDQNEKLNYYLFGLQNSIVLTNATGEKIPCNIYHYERSTNSMNRNRFFIGFERPKDSKGTVEFESTFLSCGKIKFYIEEFKK